MPWPRFLEPKVNRFLLDLVSKRYGQRPSEYLLSEDPLGLLRYQIDQVCAQTGIEIEGLLQETKDGYDEKHKKVRVAKYDISELLKDDFNPHETKRKYRSVSGMSVAGRPDDPGIPSAESEIDVSDMVDD